MADVFQDLAVGTKFYRGVDQDGGLIIFRPQTRTRTADRQLTNEACTALALTEICCDKGKGKIYVFAQNTRSGVYGARIDAFRAFNELPDLLYVPYIWSEGEKKEWKEMKPIDQLHRLSARYGWILKNTPVLPIALDFDQQPYNMARLMGYTKSLVTIYISPQPHIGYTDEMRRALGPIQFATSGTSDELRSPQYVDLMKDLDGFLVDGGVGLINKLEDIFWRGRNSAKSTYGIELLQLIKAGETAADANQAYGILGEKSK